MKSVFVLMLVNVVVCYSVLFKFIVFCELFFVNIMIFDLFSFRASYVVRTRVVVFSRDIICLFFVCLYVFGVIWFFINIFVNLVLVYLCIVCFVFIVFLYLLLLLLMIGKFVFVASLYVCSMFIIFSYEINLVFGSVNFDVDM